MLGNLLGGFIVILVGVNLMPTVADSVYCASNSDKCGGAHNVTGAAATILGLTNIFFALGIMSAGVNLTIGGLRQAGLV